ncbi:MAG: cupin domain-containing protein [Solirubrobacteraceae bacterium]
MSVYTIRRIEQMRSLHHGAVKLAGAELGVRAFGMQLLDLPAGFDDYPEHDHRDDGQEEVYVVMRGAAELEVDGERLAVIAGQMVRVSPEARRRLRPGAGGATILAIGAPGGTGYRRPEQFELGGDR